MRKAVCLLMLVAGCGGAVGPEATAGRATVGEVFARCRAFGMSDGETDTFIIIARESRDLGNSLIESMELFVAVCDKWPSGSEGRSTCTVCIISVLDFVYE